MISRQMLEVVSIFDTGSRTLKYDRAENPKDGRGFVCGIGNFTIEEARLFKGFIPERNWSRKDFDVVWKESCKTYQTFKTFQEHLVMKIYGKPVEEVFKGRGFTSPVTLLCLFDTAQQDLRSFVRIVNAADEGETENEREWCTLFLKIRRKVLTNSKRKGQTGRVTVLEGFNETQVIKTNFEVPPD